MDPVAWIEEYFRAWRERDPDRAAALFTEDAIYRSEPCREVHSGREAIWRYWHDATATQSDIEIRVGQPLVAPEAVVVEWWVTLAMEGEVATIPGCLLLRFAPDGRCFELREYWNLNQGRHEPPAGWGVF
jgi:hypothetical protein